MSEASRKGIKALGQQIYDAYKKHGHTGPSGEILDMSPNAQDERFLAAFNKQHGTKPQVHPMYSQNGHVGADGRVLDMSPKAQDDRFLAEFNRKHGTKPVQPSQGLDMSPQAQDDRFIADVQRRNDAHTAWTRKKAADRGGQ